VLFCSEILSNKCVKPFLLKRRFEIKLENLVRRSYGTLNVFWKMLKVGKTHQNKAFFYRTNRNAAKSSYKISHLIVKAGKNLTIGENLILPAATEIVFFVCLERKRQNELKQFHCQR
jgi:hypothetical protein